MAIFLTGGTGKTSIRIAGLLQDAKIPFLLGSRRGASAAPSGMVAVKFDWLDDSTFKNPFEHKLPSGEAIKAVYLVAPEVDDPAPSMNAFIDYATKEHGVKRFVLMAGSSAEPGGWHVGKVWSHLLDIGVEYAVLKPSWFMENMSEGFHQSSIRDRHQLYTACADGKIPFISAEDIAAVAFRTLTDEKPHNTSYRVLGPELLTHDQIAEKLSKVLGRDIKNVKPTEEERKKSLTDAGLPQHYADFLTSLEVMAAKNLEALEGNDVEKVTGRPPQSFDTFAEKNKAAWR
ncbi:putative ergot alkaloid biosynthetic protein a protein [Neofusicoccum parvum]|uniref:Ergot alkaloid biosynthetic protein a protein n=1 Tax=Neofusicoccum parvum TaxID=310453 RepID=A0ACB5S674_9PEZI|nr:putative ergot alkaloid biosynthetic protein a protein [Neofusicoccum parvum]